MATAPNGYSPEWLHTGALGIACHTGGLPLPRPSWETSDPSRATSFNGVEKPRLKESNEEKGLRIYGQGFTTTWEDGSRVAFSLDIWSLSECA